MILLNVGYDSKGGVHACLGLYKKIVEKAIDEEGGEHARGVDCHALKRIDTCTIAELQKTTTTTTTTK